MGLHSGSGHDIFTLADSLLRKQGEKSLDPNERKALCVYADETKMLCSCTVKGSMDDGTEIFTEMLERTKNIYTAVQYIRSGHSALMEESRAQVGENESEQEYLEKAEKNVVKEAENVIAVDFRNRRRYSD